MVNIINRLFIASSYKPIGACIGGIYIVVNGKVGANSEYIIRGDSTMLCDVL